MIAIRELDQSHNEEMLEILENSLMRTNGLDLHFDKSPDIFATTRLWSDNFKYYGVFANDNLAGFGMYLIYAGFIGSRLEEILYIGNFCIDTRYRKRGFLFKLAEHIHRKVPKDCQYGFCMILKGNKRAERYFEQESKLLPFLPSIRIKLAYETRSILILGPKQSNPDFPVRQATQKDIPLLNEFITSEHTPGFLMHELNSKFIEHRISLKTGLKIEDYFIAYQNNKIIGFCAAWNVSNFKRTRILRYKNGFKVIRLIYKLVSLIFRYPDLPENGEAIKEIYITDLAIKGTNHLILKSILKSIYKVYQEKKYNLINIGSFKGDPLLKATNAFFSSPLYSGIYFSAINDGKNSEATELIGPSIDIALL